jgi:hypothetical protein
MRVLPVLVLLLLPTACARFLDVSGSEWAKEGTSFQQVTFDEVECARETERAGDLPDTIVGGVADAVVVPLEDVRRLKAYDRCMEGKGYQHVARRR